MCGKYSNLGPTTTITAARTWPWARVFRTRLRIWPLDCRSRGIDLMTSLRFVQKQYSVGYITSIRWCVRESNLLIHVVLIGLLRTTAAREGRPLDSKDINAAASEAAEFSRNTEFSKAATAMIQGDRALAEQWCQREREERGEQAAIELMQRIEKAVRDKLALMEANRATLRSRNNHRR